MSAWVTKCIISLKGMGTERAEKAGVLWSYVLLLWSYAFVMCY